MHRPLRRRLAPEARKQEILEAAERLLLARGPRVRVEDVVREAGVAKGTFFVYFPTWDDLLDTIRARLVLEFGAAFPLPAEGDGAVDWPSLIERQAAGFVDFSVSRRGIGKVLFHSEFAHRRPLPDNGFLRLTRLIREGQAAGTFGPVAPEPTARLLLAAIHAAADAVAGGAPRDATLAALAHLLRRTLAP